MLALGAVGCVPSVLAACGGSTDEDVFGATATDAPDATTAATTASTATDGTSAATAAPATTAATGTSGGVALPDTATLQVDFTFTPSGGGRVRNPYIAVWIEDAQGSLVRTVSLWYREREAKYLRELTRWMSVDGSDETLETVSDATKVAGSYSVVWDGTDRTGARVAAGDYVLCVEAAREHGPYEIVTGTLTLGADPFTVDLGADEELTAVAAQYVV